MRIAVVFVPDKSRDKLLSISKALAAGIEKNGHNVDIVDGSRDVNTKLSIYEYICVGTEVVSLIGGKIPEQVGGFLRSAGIVTGKRSFAFVLKKGLGTGRGLQRLMKVMESQGMMLKYSEVLRSKEESEEIGKRLKIEKSH